MAASALIDRGTICRLIVTRLEAAIAAETLTLPIRHPREGVPEAESYMLLLPLSLRRTPRRMGADEADECRFTARFLVVVGEDHDGIADFDRFASELVVALMTDAALTDGSSPPNHLVEFDDVDESADPQWDLQRKAVQQLITFTGRARRLTGTTVDDFD